MQIQTQISVDLNRPCTQTVPAMQHDGSTRAVEIALLRDGQPWQPPEGVTAAIGYEKPDRTRSAYDRLPDGSAAVTLNGSTAAVLLSAQMLSVPGCVRACLVFRDEELNQLTTFPFQVQVQVNPAAEAPQVEDYCRLQWLEEKLDEYLRLAKDSGEFTGPVGPGPVLLGQEVAFQISQDYRQIPTGAWSEALPSCSAREFVWSRTTAHYDSGDVITYSVSRNGADGDGAVVSVCGIGPDDTGNIPLTAEAVGALPCVGGTVQGQIDMGGQKLTGLPDPTQDSDAAGKGYVDTQATAAVTAAKQAVKTRFVSFLLTVGDWAGTEAPYTQFIPISNLTEDKLTRAYPVYYDDMARNLAVKEASAAVSFAKRTGGGITFTCLEEKPASDIPVTVEVYV